MKKQQIPQAWTGEAKAVLQRHRSALSRFLQRWPAERALHVVAAWIFYVNLPRATVIAWLEELLVDLKNTPAGPS